MLNASNIAVYIWVEISIAVNGHNCRCVWRWPLSAIKRDQASVAKNSVGCTRPKQLKLGFFDGAAAVAAAAAAATAVATVTVLIE